jgi:hypothetical protein
MKIKRLYPPPLWVRCLAAAIFLHSAALYLFIKHPFFLKAQIAPLFAKTKPALPTIYAKDEPSLEDPLQPFLEEFFLQGDLELAAQANRAQLNISNCPQKESKWSFTSSEPSEVSPLLEEITSSFLPPPVFTGAVQEEIALHKPDFSALQELPMTLQESVIHPFPTISEENSEAKLEIPLQDFLASSYFPMKEAPSSQDLTTSPLEPLPLTLQEARSPIGTQRKNYFSSPSEDRACPLAQAPSFSLAFHRATFEPTHANIDQYLPTQTLYKMQWNDSFHVSPSFFPDDDGYVFFLTITPKQDLQTQKIKQNIYLLIDTSSEIEKHKVSVFKKSAMKALACLQPGDNFNIFLLDKTITSFSPHSCPFSLQNLHKAEQFLEKSHEKNLFSSHNLLQNLQDAFAMIGADEEVHTAILLTNGKFSSNISSRQKALNQLLEKNRGKIHLFTAAVGKNNDLVNLDMLSSLCGGKLLYSDTNASFPRKLSSFVKSMKSPLIKDIALSIQAKSAKAGLTLLSSNVHMPNLYSSEPFIITGKIDRLSDLSITLEGRNEDGWILINKDISFENAPEASSSLKREWFLKQASKLYEQFLLDPKGPHLKEAKELFQSVHGRSLGE